MRFCVVKRMGALACALLVCLCAAACPALAQYESRNPLLAPQSVRYAGTEDTFFNLLLMGIDLGQDGYWGSFGKDRLEECHADAMLVVSVNLSDSSVDLVSLPRDTVTYVPGVCGIYKLNGAVHCGDTLEQGLERACDAASWLLGGVKVDRYCAVDMNTMIRMGDAIGGVDFDMDMSYTGHSGRVYRKGMQHLDGVGIMDYLRARKNATVNGNDIGRTGRHRELMLAVFSKLRSQPELLAELAGMIGAEGVNILTNIGLADIIRLAQAAAAVDVGGIGSHVITGPYRTALDGWNFTFTDQQARLDVLREVYGIEAEPLKYVSRKYCEWLMEKGFLSVRYIDSAQRIAQYADGVTLTGAQQDALSRLRAQIDVAAQAFDDAADAMNAGADNAMIAARKELRAQGEALAEAIGYPERINWAAGAVWYKDQRINDYQYMWQ